jgi:hypothetical protein
LGIVNLTTINNFSVAPSNFISTATYSKYDEANDLALPTTGERVCRSCNRLFDWLPNLPIVARGSQFTIARQSYLLFSLFPHLLSGSPHSVGTEKTCQLVSQFMRTTAGSLSFLRSRPGSQKTRVKQLIHSSSSSETITWI